MLTEPAPVVVFCYNRPQHLARTLEALRLNPLASQSPLIVFSDGARDQNEVTQVEEVRALLSVLTGFGSIQIVASPTNKGLARSVIEGVTEVLQSHERVIVLEDDMLCTSDFLDYMNQALETYARRQDIFSVTGYTPPVKIPPQYNQDVYLAPRASSWGWGTWRSRWEKANWTLHGLDLFQHHQHYKKLLSRGGEDLWPMLVKQQRGIIDSWAVRWTLTQALHNAYGLYPVRSKIVNIGTDGSGTNFTFKTEAYGRELAEGNLQLNPDLLPDPAVVNRFKEYYRLPWRVKLKNRLMYGV